LYESQAFLTSLSLSQFTSLALGFFAFVAALASSHTFLAALHALPETISPFCAEHLSVFVCSPFAVPAEATIFF
jgi:hypothetical protein